MCCLLLDDFGCCCRTRTPTTPTTEEEQNAQHQPHLLKQAHQKQRNLVVPTVRREKLIFEFDSAVFIIIKTLIKQMRVVSPLPVLKR